MGQQNCVCPTIIIIRNGPSRHRYRKKIPGDAEYCTVCRGTGRTAYNYKLSRHVNDDDKVGKVVEVWRDGWVNAKIVAIVDDKEKVTVRYDDDDETSKGIKVSVDKT